MRVLIIGGTGLLGHKLYQVCRAAGLPTWATVRGDRKSHAYLDPDMVIGDVDVTRIGSVERAIAAVQPQAVVNCAGIVPTRAISEGPAQTIHVNAVFPHQLYDLCLHHDRRLVHISTDCVFSGQPNRCTVPNGRCRACGGYTERDPATAIGLYSQSKLLGETGTVIVRTSFVGPERTMFRGLFAWFLKQADLIKGYHRHLFTGLTTLELSRVLVSILQDYPALRGLYHVGGPPITKHDLLELFKAATGKDVVITKDMHLFSDRRLDSTKFRTATNYTPPAWSDMITAMAQDWKQCSYETNVS